MGRSTFPLLIVCIAASEILTQAIPAKIPSEGKFDTEVKSCCEHENAEQPTKRSLSCSKQNEKYDELQARWDQVKQVINLANVVLSDKAWPKPTDSYATPQQSASLPNGGFSVDLLNPGTSPVLPLYMPHYTSESEQASSSTPVWDQNSSPDASESYPTKLTMDQLNLIAKGFVEKSPATLIMPGHRVGPYDQLKHDLDSMKDSTEKKKAMVLKSGLLISADMYAELEKLFSPSMTGTHQNAYPQSLNKVVNILPQFASIPKAAESQSTYQLNSAIKTPADESETFELTLFPHQTEGDKMEKKGQYQLKTKPDSDTLETNTHFMLPSSEKTSYAATKKKGIDDLGYVSPNSVKTNYVTNLSTGYVHNILRDPATSSLYETGNTLLSNTVQGKAASPDQGSSESSHSISPSANSLTSNNGNLLTNQYPTPKSGSTNFPLNFNTMNSIFGNTDAQSQTGVSYQQSTYPSSTQKITNSNKQPVKKINFLNDSSTAENQLTSLSSILQQTGNAPTQQQDLKSSQYTSLSSADLKYMTNSMPRNNSTQQQASTGSPANQYKLISSSDTQPGNTAAQQQTNVNYPSTTQFQYVTHQQKEDVDEMLQYSNNPSTQFISSSTTSPNSMLDNISTQQQASTGSSANQYTSFYSIPIENGNIAGQQLTNQQKENIDNMFPYTNNLQTQFNSLGPITIMMPDNISTQQQDRTGLPANQYTLINSTPTQTSITAGQQQSNRKYPSTSELKYVINKQTGDSSNMFQNTANQSKQDIPRTTSTNSSFFSTPSSSTALNYNANNPVIYGYLPNSSSSSSQILPVNQKSTYTGSSTSQSTNYQGFSPQADFTQTQFTQSAGPSVNSQSVFTNGQNQISGSEQPSRSLQNTQYNSFTPLTIIGSNYQAMPHFIPTQDATYSQGPQRIPTSAFYQSPFVDSNGVNYNVLPKMGFNPTVGSIPSYPSTPSTFTPDMNNQYETNEPQYLQNYPTVNGREVEHQSSVFVSQAGPHNRIILRDGQHMTAVFSTKSQPGSTVLFSSDNTNAQKINNENNFDKDTQSLIKQYGYTAFDPALLQSLKSKDNNDKAYLEPTSSMGGTCICSDNTTLFEGSLPEKIISNESSIPDDETCLTENAVDQTSSVNQTSSANQTSSVDQTSSKVGSQSVNQTSSIDKIQAVKPVG